MSRILMITPFKSPCKGFCKSYVKTLDKRLFVCYIICMVGIVLTKYFLIFEVIVMVVKKFSFKVPFTDELEFDGKRFDRLVFKFSFHDDNRIFYTCYRYRGSALVSSAFSFTRSLPSQFDITSFDDLYYYCLSVINELLFAIKIFAPSIKFISPCLFVW